MDPTVQCLPPAGAVFVFLDVPRTSEVGIDCKSWNVGPHFRGIKMIPPGLHFIYYSAVGIDRQPGPRTGFFHNFTAGEMLVRQWNAQTEDMKSEPVDEAQYERFRNSRQELDRYLGTYPHDCYKKWVSLTSKITPAVVARLQPLSSKICSVPPLLSEPSTTESRREAAKGKRSSKHSDGTLSTSQSDGTQPSTTQSDGTQPSTSQNDQVETKTSHLGQTQPATTLTSAVSGLSPSVSSEDARLQSVPGSEVSDDARLPALQCVPGSELRFTAIPRQKYPVGASPSEVTRCSLDHSYVLETLLTSVYRDDPAALLGEVQFAFVCFLLGQVYSAFEQWKQLVRLLCVCDRALTDHSALYTDLISVLHFQLREIPEDFFVDIVSTDNFLTSTLQVFFSNLSVLPPPLSALRDRGLSFRRHLEARFKWDFVSEPDDEAPVVVDL